MCFAEFIIYIYPLKSLRQIALNKLYRTKGEPYGVSLTSNKL